MDGQMKKGVLELCVLSQIARGSCYGYEIAKSVRAFFPEVNESTVYAILRRLRADGAVETFPGTDSNGPVRKYYKLTRQGGEALSSALDDWRQVAAAVNALCF